MRVAVAFLLSWCSVAAPSSLLAAGLQLKVVEPGEPQAEPSDARSARPIPVVLVNCDDDDRDGVRDCDDARINGPDDLDDLMRLRLGADEPLAAGTRLEIVLRAPPHKAWIWRPSGDGWRRVGGDEAWSFDAGELDAASSDFLVECGAFADADWNGEISVSARILDDPTAQPASVALRAAPLRMLASTERATRLLVREFPGRNDAMLAQLADFARMSQTELTVIPGNAPYAAHHIWLQDAVEFCEQTNERHRMVVAVPANRNRPIDLFAKDRLLEPGIGFVPVGSYRDEFARGEGGTSWIDWYGNLEASPSSSKHPCGRLLYGVDRQRGAQLNPQVIAFFAAQGLQPPLPLDVGWLLIKHVDETVGFVPGTDADSPYLALVPDVCVTLELLEALRADGHGAAVLFEPYEQGTTVDAVLDDAAGVAANQRLQRERIDPLIASLEEELDLAPQQIIRLPALFRPDGASRMPNVVNALVANGHVAMADPRGPRIAGDDAFQTEVRRRLANAPIQIHFVDDEVYHRWSGNVHCATNSLRRSSVPCPASAEATRSP